MTCPLAKGKKFGSAWSGATNAVLGNWQVDLIEGVTSGFPLFVVDGSDPTESGTFFNYNGYTFTSAQTRSGIRINRGRNAVEPGCIARREIHTNQNWFNPCAFRACASRRARHRCTRTRLRSPFREHGFFNDQEIPFDEEHESAIPSRVLQSVQPSAVLSARDAAGTGEQDINTLSTVSACINNTVNNHALIQFALKLKF